MLYKWRGLKPHHRHTNVFGDRDRNGMAGIEVRRIEIAPGEAFEPTAEELAAFGDLMEPIGADLAPSPPEEYGRDPDIVEEAYYISPRGNNWFDVVRRADGEVVNDKALRQVDAEKTAAHMIVTEVQPENPPSVDDESAQRADATV